MNALCTYSVTIYPVSVSKTGPLRFGITLPETDQLLTDFWQRGLLFICLLIVDEKFDTGR